MQLEITLVLTFCLCSESIDAGKHYFRSQEVLHDDDHPNSNHLPRPAHPHRVPLPFDHGVPAHDDTHTPLATQIWVSAKHAFTILADGKILLIILAVGAIVTGLSIHSYFMQRDTKQLRERVEKTAAVAGGSEPPDPSGGSQTMTEQEVPSDTGGTESDWSKTWLLLMGWLTDPAYKWKSRGFCVLVIIHWVLREASWAFILSANHAELVNALTELHASQDSHRVMSSLYTVLLWEIIIEVPLFFILDPWVSTWFRLSLRDYMTTRALSVYLDQDGKAFYRIKMKENQNHIDNPDQRIAEDIEVITEQIYDIYASVLSAVLGVSMWTFVIFHLGGKILLIVAGSMAILRFAIAYGYFGNRLVGALQGVLRTGANLRYGLMRVRDNAEGVVLIGGEAREQDRNQDFFDNHLNAIRKKTWVFMLYETVMRFMNFFPGIILWLFQIAAILKGTLNVGDAIRVHQGYDQVAKVLDFMARNFLTIMTLHANVDRLDKLWNCCEVENSKSTKAEVAKVTNIEHEVEQVKFETIDSPWTFHMDNVSISAPGSDIMVGGVEFRCKEGESIFLSGDSGLGKSSILRSLAGLWTDGRGIIRVAGDVDVLFLTQSSYTPYGSLLEISIYPRAVPTEPPELKRLMDAADTALTKATLGPLLNRWGLGGQARDWAVILSAGEKQRLGFARLFLALELNKMAKEKGEKSKRILAVLDESTSAIQVSMEAQLYNELRSELHKGHLCSLVSCGHRPSLRQWHDSELRIGDQVVSTNSNWTNIRPETPPRTYNEGTWQGPHGIVLPWCHIELVHGSAS